MFTRGEFSIAATKKYFAQTENVDFKIHDQLPHISSEGSASYFVEIQDNLLTNTRYEDSNTDLRSMNERLLSVDVEKK